LTVKRHHKLAPPPNRQRVRGLLTAVGGMSVLGDVKGHLWRHPSCPRCFRNNPIGRADGRIGADPASCCMASCPRCDTRTVSQKMGESWVQCRRRGSWPTRGIWLTRGADPPRGSVQCAFVQSQVKTNRFQSHGPGHVRETERGAVAGLSAPFDSEGSEPVTMGSVSMFGAVWSSPASESQPPPLIYTCTHLFVTLV
jgi:hypothetical protein